MVTRSIVGVDDVVILVGALFLLFFGALTGLLLIGFCFLLFVFLFFFFVISILVNFLITDVLEVSVVVLWISLHLLFEVLWMFQFDVLIK